VYQWLARGDDAHLDTLVRRCRETVLGRYLAVTSIDSGVPSLTEQQQQAGWTHRSGVAYSGAVRSADELFYQRDGPNSPGYDEWYVFDEPVTGEIASLSAAETRRCLNWPS
jgi:hypothetical protein